MNQAKSSVSKTGKTTSKKQLAYEFIRSKILKGIFVPGYRVTIDDLARQLHLSNSPIREALHQLEADGLIRMIPYTGAVVQMVNEDEYLETMYVLAILDGAATALAAKNFSKKDIDNLRAINTAMHESLNNFDILKFSELNRKFHETIYRKCGNSYLIDRLSAIWQRLSQGNNARFSFVPQRARESIQEHETIITMIANVDPANKIEAFIRQHKNNMIKAVQHSRKQRNAEK